MVFNIIGLSVYAYIYWTIRANINERTRLIENGVLEEKDAIKYDGEALKKYLILFLISAIYSLLNSGMAFALYSLGDINIISGFFLIFFVGTTLFSAFKYIDGIVYIRKFKAQGLVTPDDSKSYEYSTKNLISIAELENVSTDERRDHISIIFAIVYMVVFDICELYNVGFKFLNPQYGNGPDELIIFLACLDVFWLINAIVTFIKSDNIRYKNSKEIMRGKKNRASYSAMTAILIIFGLMTIFGKHAVHSFAEYIFRVHHNDNIMMAENIKYAVRNGYVEGMVPDYMKDDLNEGIDILTYPVPQEISDYIFEATNYNSYKEMSDNIKNTNGIPEIIVQFNEGQIEVTITNIYEPNY